MSKVVNNASCDTCFYSEVCATHQDEKNRNPIFPHNWCEKHLDRATVENALKTVSGLNIRSFPNSQGEKVNIHQHLTSLNIDGFAKWIAENCGGCETPWSKWLQQNYCNKCGSVMVYSKWFGRDMEVAPCEQGECPFNVKDLPKETLVKMWLEQLWEEKPNNE